MRVIYPYGIDEVINTDVGPITVPAGSTHTEYIDLGENFATEDGAGVVLPGILIAGARVGNASTQYAYAYFYLVLITSDSTYVEAPVSGSMSFPPPSSNRTYVWHWSAYKFVAPQAKIRVLLKAAPDEDTTFLLHIWAYKTRRGLWRAHD